MYSILPSGSPLLFYKAATPQNATGLVSSLAIDTGNMLLYAADSGNEQIVMMDYSSLFVNLPSNANVNVNVSVNVSAPAGSVVNVTSNIASNTTGNATANVNVNVNISAIPTNNTSNATNSTVALQTALSQSEYSSYLNIQDSVDTLVGLSSLSIDIVG
jgi:hypothetical protein